MRIPLRPLLGDALAATVLRALGLVCLAGCAGRSPAPAARGIEAALAARRWDGRDPPATARSLAAVAFAKGQVGKRYCWGGVGPSCFDCSGLVARAWGSVGVRLPHSSEAIASQLVEVPVEDVRAGDVLWWPGHVALYAGDGRTIEALDARDGVIERMSRDPRRAYRP